MKLSAKHVSFTILLLAAACQGRSHQGVVVDNNSNTNANPGGPGAPGTAAGGLRTGGTPSDNVNGSVIPGATAPAASLSVAAQMKGTWTGADDDFSLAVDPTTKKALWAIKSVTGTVPPAATTAAAATTTKPPTTTTAPPAAGASAVAYDTRAAQILNSNCTSCHSAGGSQAGTPMDSYDSAKALGAGIVSRSANGSMPPGGAMAAADVQALQAWQSGGFQKGAGGAAAPTTTDAGNSGAPTLTLTEDAQGNCLNTQKVTAKVGQTLTIKNNCKSGYIPHTPGTPFPHGDSEIPAGGSQQYQLAAPSQGGMYRHTDGSDNSTNQPLNLEVN